MLAGFEVLAVVVVVVVAAGAAAVAPPRSRGPRAGFPHDSANSRRRASITPSRDAICRCSKAIIACSAVGGGGGGGGQEGPPPPLRPLERERLRAARLSMVAGEAPARKAAIAAPMAVKTAGRCRRAASWVATPSWSPIVLRARGRKKGKTQKRQTKHKKCVAQLGSLTTCRFTTRGLKNTQKRAKSCFT